jgi:hypothetical protein
MATLSMHLVVGERVFPQIPEWAGDPSTYGTFLLGCVLVDVNLIAPIDRRKTHFCDGFYGKGAYAFDKSCENLLAQLEDALLRPWNDLSEKERAFIAGYLCHLAADEAWKAFNRRLLKKLGLARWSDLPVPAGVLMTAYHIPSTTLFVDFSGVSSALASAQIPDVLRYIPQHVLSRMWAIVGPHALNGRTPESFYSMLERMGKSAAEVREVRKNHERYWEKAVAFVREQEGIESIVVSGAERSLEVIPRLWKSAVCTNEES